MGSLPAFPFSVLRYIRKFISAWWEWWLRYFGAAGSLFGADFLMSNALILMRCIISWDLPHIPSAPVPLLKSGRLWLPWAHVSPWASAEHLLLPAVLVYQHVLFLFLPLAMQPGYGEEWAPLREPLSWWGQASSSEGFPRVLQVVQVVAMVMTQLCAHAWLILLLSCTSPGASFSLFGVIFYFLISFNFMFCFWGELGLRFMVN